MKNDRFPTSRLSPCVRIFIESLLEGTDGEILFDDHYLTDQALTSSANASSGSDESYN